MIITSFDSTNSGREKAAKEKQKRITVGRNGLFTIPKYTSEFFALKAGEKVSVISYKETDKMHSQPEFLLVKDSDKGLALREHPKYGNLLFSHTKAARAILEAYDCEDQKSVRCLMSESEQTVGDITGWPLLIVAGK